MEQQQQQRQQQPAVDLTLNQDGSVDSSQIPWLSTLLEQVEGCPFFRKLRPGDRSQVIDPNWMLPPGTEVNGNIVGAGLAPRHMNALGQLLIGLTMSDNQPFVQPSGSTTTMPTLIALTGRNGDEMPFSTQSSGLSPYLIFAGLIFVKATCDTKTMNPWKGRGDRHAEKDNNTRVMVCVCCGLYTKHDLTKFTKFISQDEDKDTKTKKVTKKDAKFVNHLKKDCIIGKALKEAVTKLYDLHKDTLVENALRLPLKKLHQWIYEEPIAVPFDE